MIDFQANFQTALRLKDKKNKAAYEDAFMYASSRVNNYYLLLRNEAKKAYSKNYFDVVMDWKHYIFCLDMAR
jgi:hypothetical protein